ncbi:SCO family protein [Methylobacterium terricola]|uniref:SCO family protein n=1 Tax=Methylobacterium terricola TaxID=2583531 RepID=A0A5C4LKV6_9HYPH|nr:SCO family protein [Methylobacterium terricola]TNC14470.1 SCO family protein [Methylobacterium terricola]
MVLHRPALAAFLVGLTCVGPSVRAQDTVGREAGAQAPTVQASTAQAAPPAGPPGGGSLLAGHFRLTAPDGTPVDTDDLAGKPYALFFGFTHCPDICPTTLAELSLALSHLPARALPVFFVSVDPERDTPEVLGRYMQSFDPGIVGLSGPRRAIDEAIRGFGIVARRTELTGGGYAYGHTATLFLIDGDGLIVDRLSPGIGPDVLAARLAALAGSPVVPGR